MSLVPPSLTLKQLKQYPARSRKDAFSNNYPLLTIDNSVNLVKNVFKGGNLSDLETIFIFSLSSPEIATAYFEHVEEYLKMKKQKMTKFLGAIYSDGLGTFMVNKHRPEAVSVKEIALSAFIENCLAPAFETQERIYLPYGGNTEPYKEFNTKIDPFPDNKAWEMRFEYVYGNLSKEISDYFLGFINAGKFEAIKKSMAVSFRRLPNNRTRRRYDSIRAQLDRYTSANMFDEAISKILNIFSIQTPDDHFDASDRDHILNYYLILNTVKRWGLTDEFDYDKKYEDKSGTYIDKFLEPTWTFLNIAPTIDYQWLATEIENYKKYRGDQDLLKMEITVGMQERKQPKYFEIKYGIDEKTYWQMAKELGFKV